MDTRSPLTESGRAKSSKISTVTNAIEKRASKLPLSFFLTIAGGALLLSAGLAASKKRSNMASFVGQWVPTILLLGIYDKIVASEASKKEESKFHLLH